MTPEVFDQLAERGQAIYDNKLKAQLEPNENGHVVAIHIDTEDFALGRNSQEAVHHIRLRHAEGRLVILTIGPEPDYALAGRLLGGEMLAGRSK